MQKYFFERYLLPVRSPVLVERYNAALMRAGLSPTTLQAFDVDGRGWSPQVAAEKNNPFYLSHGGAVQFGITLTPDQTVLPVFRPFYSFERTVIDGMRETHARAIADLTSRAALLWEIDIGVSSITSIEDVIAAHHVFVTVEDSTGIMKVASAQRELVTAFAEKPLAWSNAELRQQIILSGKEHGDFRFRSVTIPRSAVTTRCFYAEVFGRTFVFQFEGAKRPTIIVGDDSLLSQDDKKLTYTMKDPSLIRHLFEVGLVEVPIDWYAENPQAIESLWESYVVDALCEANAQHDHIDTCTTAQLKKFALELSERLPRSFADLDRLKARLRAGESGETIRLKGPLRRMLMRPHRSLDEATKRVVWRLISGLTPISLDQMCVFDRPRFYEAFMSWSQARQRWALGFLRNRNLLTEEGAIPWSF